MNSEDTSEIKQFILIIIITLALVVPAIWKIVEWIEDIGLVEFSIYLIISLGSIVIYIVFKFLAQKER